MIVIWAIRSLRHPARKKKTDLPDELEHRAAVLLRTLEDQKARIVVPTATIAELLVPFAKEDHGQFIAELQSRFVTPSLDIRAASLAAELYQIHKGFPKVDQIQDKVRLKSDVFVIATARAAGATIFYSHDKNARKLAGHVMKAEDLPVRHENMYVDAELRGKDIWKETGGKDS